MIGSSKKFSMAAAGLTVAVMIGGVSAMASSGSEERLRDRVGQLGERVASKVGLEGERREAFLSIWKKSMKEARVRRRQMREAFSDLAEAMSSSDEEESEVGAALDDLEDSLVAFLDDRGRRITEMRKVLTQEEQRKFLLRLPMREVAALPGVKTAVPALIGHAGNKLLASMNSLSDDTRQKLQGIGGRFLEQRTRIVIKQLDLLDDLEKAENDEVLVKTILDRLVAGTEELRETGPAEIAEIRKSLPDQDTAELVMGLARKAKKFRSRARRRRDDFRGDSHREQLED